MFAPRTCSWYCPLLSLTEVSGDTVEVTLNPDGNVMLAEPSCWPRPGVEWFVSFIEKFQVEFAVTVVGEKSTVKHLPTQAAACADVVAPAIAMAEMVNGTATAIVKTRRRTAD